MSASAPSAAVATRTGRAGLRGKSLRRIDHLDATRRPCFGGAQLLDRAAQSPYGPQGGEVGVRLRRQRGAHAEPVGAASVVARSALR